VDRLLEAGGGANGFEQLQRAALASGLGARNASLRPVPPALASATDLGEIDDESIACIGALTCLLDALVPPSWHWGSTVMLEWDEHRVATAVGAVPAGEALARIRSLPWMLRPLVMRLWVMAAQPHGPASLWPREFVDGLRLCGLAMDTPLHPHVVPAFREIDA
jgi:hypothetical protein